jgi:hypothetical protein
MLSVLRVLLSRGVNHFNIHVDVKSGREHFCARARCWRADEKAAAWRLMNIAVDRRARHEQIRSLRCLILSMWRFIFRMFAGALTVVLVMAKGGAAEEPPAIVPIASA